MNIYIYKLGVIILSQEMPVARVWDQWSWWCCGTLVSGCCRSATQDRVSTPVALIVLWREVNLKCLLSISFTLFFILKESISPSVIFNKCLTGEIIINFISLLYQVFVLIKKNKKIGIKNLFEKKMNCKIFIFS